MKRLGLLLLVACVPASEPAPPRGAAGIRMMPNEATRGAPFATDDGWTVTVSELVLRAYVTATPLEAVEDFGGGSAPYLWNGRDEVDLYAPGLGLGTWQVGYQLQGAYLELGSSQDSVVDLGVDPRLAQRFREPVPFAANPYGVVYQNGPVAVVAARGAKDGRTVSIDLSLGDYRSGSEGQPADAAVTVRRDALASAHLTVDARKLFVGDDGAMTFQSIADADVNGDGVASPEELANVQVACARCVQNGSYVGSIGTLLEVLGDRVQSTPSR